ncbi:isopeptide-forming domain-containing fimbrial protein [Bifidobacterium biavatii]|uniref:Peptidoglycan linked protein (Fimbrial structural unit) (LPXTG motif) n=2 Tax=Bifidobacterium biavatii TaxID=762212 RepID=A0A086ZWF0_9BIFI|nr:isopeptide-forming domain-containing fimbrial protein [Bifidobacterium biavatii]KFI50850.1 peptidoglycan linked protein (fimbrial structural unit) (LPXTG motif) [Bifidobacterium biavatii DSM 23969]
MKKLGKAVLGLVAAVAMLVTGLVAPTTAFAAGSHTITIKNDVAGYSYTAYQVFAGTLSDDEKTLSNITWGEGVKGSEILTELKGIKTDSGSALIVVKTTGEGGQQQTNKVNPFAGIADDANAAKNVADVLGQNNTNRDFAKAFAKIVAKHLTDDATKKHVAEAQMAGDKTTSYKFSGLADGYYIIMNDSVPSTDDAAYTEYMLKVVKDIKDLEPKSKVPGFTKKVQEKNDSAATSTTDPKNPSDWQDGADYDIGDSVPFQLTATLPDDATRFAAYDTYKLTFRDQQSGGLDTPSTFTVTVVSKDGRTTTTIPQTGKKTNAQGTVEDHPNFTVQAPTQVETLDGDTFRIAFTDVKDLYTAPEDGAAGTKITVAAGDKIVVDYNSTLNSKAVIGEPGNPNKARLEYSNNPNDEGEGHSPWDDVTVFTFDLNANKVDKDGQPLKGAGFRLEKWVVDEKAKQGSWVTVGEQGPWQKAEASDSVTAGTADQWGYKLVNGKRVDATEDADKPTSFKWTGVDSGTYKLSEIQTPDSTYNKIDDQYFAVEATYSTNHDQTTPGPTTVTFKFYSADASGVVDKSKELKDSWSVTNRKETDPTDNKVEHTYNTGFSTNIVNVKGSELPETGGIGTVILYALGGAFVVAAGLWFGLRRRFSNR